MWHCCLVFESVWSITLVKWKFLEWKSCPWAVLMPGAECVLHLSPHFIIVASLHWNTFYIKEAKTQWAEEDFPCHVAGKSQSYGTNGHVQRLYSVSSLWCFQKSWPLWWWFYTKHRGSSMGLIFSLLMWEHLSVRALPRVLGTCFHHGFLKSESCCICKFLVIVKQITQLLSLILLISTDPFQSLHLLYLPWR